MKSNFDNQCIVFFNELKLNKKHRYLIYKIVNDKVMQKKGEREEDWPNFLQSLPSNEPRMCVYDLGNLIFCYWLPNGTPLKIKLQYATIKQNFKNHLDMLKEITINSLEDYTKQDVLNYFSK